MATQTTRVSVAAEVRGQARVFTILWAIAHLTHLLRKAEPDRPLVWVVLVAALLLLEKPTSRARLALLAGAQLIYLYTRLPIADNHLVIMGFVNLGLLASVLISLRRADIAPASYPPAGALPYVRLVLLISYGAAALAKLNHGFFDTNESCAVSLFHDAVSALGGSALHLSASSESVLPFIVVGAELAVPILLLVPATRLVGVTFTIVFHLAVSFSPSATALDFTIVLFALLFLFLPVRSATHVEGRVHKAVTRFKLSARVTRSTGFIVLSVLLASLVDGDVFEFATVEGNRNWLVLFPVAVVLGALLLDATWHAWRRSWPRSTPFNPRHPIYFVLAGLVLLNAASPYLGGKTVTSFTMYSNLQTEDMTSNHFFLPRLPVTTGQDDLVRVIDSSNAVLREIGDDGVLITWQELRRSLSADSKASIRYERGGDIFEYREARENPDLITLDSISAHLIAHRPFDPDRPRCRW